MTERDMFKALAEYIMEELGDAEKYIKKALCLRGEMPQLADMFFTLSNEEMTHMAREHAALKTIAANDPQEYALALELVEGHATEWMKAIKVLQEMYRE